MTCDWGPLWTPLSAMVMWLASSLSASVWPWKVGTPCWSRTFTPDTLTATRSLSGTRLQHFQDTFSNLLKKKQGWKTSSCEWVVFKWALRSFVDWPPIINFILLKSFWRWISSDRRIKRAHRAVRVVYHRHTIMSIIDNDQARVVGGG